MTGKKRAITPVLCTVFTRPNHENYQKILLHTKFEVFILKFKNCLRNGGVAPLQHAATWEPPRELDRFALYDECQSILSVDNLQPAAFANPKALWFGLLRQLFRGDDESSPHILVLLSLMDVVKEGSKAQLNLDEQKCKLCSSLPYTRNKYHEANAYFLKLVRMWDVESRQLR
ncbi:hypothetical protein ABG067_006129 [Albugo candida]